MKSEDKLEGASNFKAWKTRIDLILAKNKFFHIVKRRIEEQSNDAGKQKLKNDDITAMSLIVDSIRDHMFPYISKLETSMKMYDTLTNLFIVNNIG